ncbi:hypothetical protein PM10SUCC1_00630 [Propionigenium maris DSM 9537]|uniref:Signal peptidase I n=1 Tax=Propionigenium maris DSM 9537 TaxID=1123000 RepID=A0A9W6GFY3_9FUSO|nr:signal peptidase I [Propionigenium maris]GLI54548.1 hypothetical protein PM10SUCC1_00630 [Propionigenium maris DSM 9537]
MGRSTEDKKKDSQSLCYEVVLPGLGSKNYILSSVFIFLLIYKTYSYITPEVTDYSLGIEVLIFIGWIINYLIKFLELEKLDEKFKDIIYSLIFPGLDLLISGKKLMGILVLSGYLLLLSSGSLLSGLYHFIYLFLYKRIIRYRKLAVIFLIYNLFLEFPLLYLEEVKNKAFYIASGSMEPTLTVGEEYLARATDDIQAGDICIFYPNDAYSNMFAKRVVGIEGDRLMLDKNKLYLNGSEVEGISYSSRGDLKEGQEIIVKKNKVYVLGDNTEKSYDSREFGMIDKKYIYGKVTKKTGSDSYLIDRWKVNRDRK